MLPGKKYGPADILPMVGRRKWLLLIPPVVGTILAGAAALLLPNTYQASTTIMVVPQKIPDAYVRSTVTTRIEDRLPAISQQIMTRNRLEKLILDYNLYPDYRKTAVMEDVVGKMRGGITVQVIRGDAFTLSFTYSDPRAAMRITERLASLYIEESLRDREVLAEQTSQFLESQLADAKRRLLETERKLEDYKRRFRGELPTQLQTNLQVLNNSQLQLQSLLEQVAQDRDRRLLLERQIGEASTPDPTAAVALPAGTDAATGGAAQQLEAARQALANLELRLKPEHPDVVKAKRLIIDLERKAEAEALQRPIAPDGRVAVSAAEAARLKRLDTLRAELDNLDRQLSARQREEQDLRQRIALYQSRVDAAPARESEMVEVTREYSTLQGLYQSLLSKREESQLSANLERRQIGEQFKVLDPARMPERPASPNRPLLLALGVVGGLGCGLLLAGFLEYRDSALRSDEDVVVSLALPVLAIIPFIKTEVERQRLRRRRLVVACAVTVVLGVGAAGLLWRLSS